MLLAVNVSCKGNWGKRPPYKLFKHEHTNHAGNESKGSSVRGSSDVHIIPIFSLRNISPILLYWCLVVSNVALKNVLSEKAHPEVDGCLMLCRYASKLFVEGVEVVFSLGIALASHNN